MLDGFIRFRVISQFSLMTGIKFLRCTSGENLTAKIQEFKWLIFWRDVGLNYHYAKLKFWLKMATFHFFGKEGAEVKCHFANKLK